MPPVIRGNWSGNMSEIREKFSSSDFGYEYPSRLDLRPGSKLHDDIVTRVMQLAKDSYDVINKRHAGWNEIDQTMTAYIPLSEYEKKLQKADTTKPVSIVVPYSYSVLETVLAYNTKAFLRDTIFGYDGYAPEDTVAAKLLELVVDQQTRYFKSALDIHTGFRDGFCYGFHASAVNWTQKLGKKPVVTQIPKFSSAGTLLGVQSVKTNQPTVLFEGNEITPLDPYKCLPDPNVSIHKAQKGEFFGWFENSNIQNLLSEERSGGLFNVKYVKEVSGNPKFASMFSGDRSKRSKEGINEPLGSIATNEVVRLNVYVTLVPKDWGLPPGDEFNPEGDMPEKWTFTIINDVILVSCAPLGLNHNMYPVAFNSPDFDGYSISPIGRLEMDAGLQKVLNFLFNSHITNVRKAINDMFVVDPSLISLKDLQNPEPGKLIRLRRTAWGRGVKDAIEQLAVQDITRLNLSDASYVTDFMQRVGATPDAAMGVQRQGGPDRVTAAEFTGTFGGSISRLERLATVTSLQYMQDLGFLHASHTQQLMEEAPYVKAVGDWPKVLRDEYGQQGEMPYSVQVSPFDIVTAYDVVQRDNSMATAERSSLAFWTQALPAIFQQPLLFSILDVPQIFKHVARLSGEKNVNDFIQKGGSVQSQVVGDAAVQKELAAGNLVPLEATTGGGE